MSRIHQFLLHLLSKLCYHYKVKCFCTLEQFQNPSSMLLPQDKIRFTLEKHWLHLSNDASVIRCRGTGLQPAPALGFHLQSGPQHHSLSSLIKAMETEPTTWPLRFCKETLLRSFVLITREINTLAYTVVSSFKGFVQRGLR